MKCNDDGLLLTYLDGELPVAQAVEVEMHLAQCAQCRQTLANLEHDQAFVNKCLSIYAMDINQMRNSRVSRKRGVSIMTKNYKKYVAVAAVAGFMLSFSFAPVRAVAQDFLTLFRVDKVETVAIDPQQLNDVQRIFYEKTGKAGHMEVENFGTISNNGKGTQKNVKLAEAKQIATIDFKSPQWLPFQSDKTPEVYVNGQEEIYFKLKVGNVNNLLESLGSKTLLPQSLDGQTFTLVKPDSYSMGYYKEGNNPNDWKDDRHLNIVQSKSPEIKVPADVDVLQLRKAILEIPVIPDEIRKQLASIEDWQNTLIIPDTKGQAEKVDINGAQGVLVTHGGDTKTIIWQRDGVVTIVEGNLTKDELIKTAASMR